MRTLHKRAAYTLVEILTALAILGVLVALLLPAVQAARAAARRITCQNHLRQLALAVQNHESAHGQYPPGCLFGKYGIGPDSTAWSWIAHVLPYAENQALYEQGQIPEATLRESGIAAARIDVLLCPEDGVSRRGPRRDAGNLDDFAVGHTNYKAVCGANWGSDSSLRLAAIGSDWPNLGTRFNGTSDGQDHGDGIMFRSDYRFRQRPAAVRDGLSNTLMIGEVLPANDRYCSWPYSNNAYATCAIPLNSEPLHDGVKDPFFWPNALSFRSLHSGGANFALADGSVRFVTDSISLEVYRAYATIQGGERVSLP